MSVNELLNGKRILIVDDEPDVLEVLEELLTNCELVKAATFDEAKPLLETRDFDLAILDIMGVNGYRLLEVAKKRGIPAVMLTAHAFTPDNLVKSIKGGAASYIPKEEISRIKEFLTDVLKACREGRNPWEPWEEKLPSSYFEKRWGAAWRDTDKEFWETFRRSIRSRSLPSVEKDRG